MAKSNTGGDGAAGDAAPQSLSERVLALTHSWEELQSEGWNALAAAAQYEELEKISAQAEQEGARAVAAPAVEAAVYLCTFVEGRLYPSNAQRAKLNDLLGRLRAAVDEAPQRVRPSKPRAVEQRQVLYLREPSAAQAGLVTQFSRQRYAVRPVGSAAEAIADAERSPPDVLLVDAGSIAPLAEVIEAIERARGEAKGRAACVVFGAEIEHARQLFAQRAGADVVVETTDMVALSTQVDELLAQQRSLDYRVLIVEDDRGQAQFCESVLHLRGISTRVVAVGEEALDEAAKFRPDLVLLDLYLPGINGIEVAQRIRERPEHAFLPIVFLSGETDLDKRFDAIRMGGDDFITKPVKPRHLLTEVETRIRRARQMPARAESAPRVERRGTLAARPTFMEAVQHASNAPEASALVMVGVAGDKALRERLGLVGAGVVSQQFAAALCSEIDLLRPVCAYGELAFLGLMQGENDAALRGQLDALRDRLAARRWAGAAEPLELSIAVVGVRLSPDGPQGDAAVQRLRGLARQVRDDGGVAWEPLRSAASNEDPVVRLARTLLKGPLIPEAIRIEYQALVPLTGGTNGQYATRFSLVAPRATTRMEVPPERMRELARELGVVPAADRQCLRRALAVLSERVSRGDEMRLFLPVGIESVLDPAFAPWLATELQARALSPTAVVLEIVAADLVREVARIGDALTSLQVVGTRLCVAGLEGGDAHIKLLRLPTVSLVRLAAPGAREAVGAWGAERGRLIVEAGKHSKTTVAHGAKEAREIAELLKLGVGYVASDTFAPWSNEASFDFAGSRT